MDGLKHNVPVWASLNQIGSLRVVKSSYIWLAVVPLVAKVLRPLAPEVHLQVFGTKLSFAITLPFSWQMFFYSSLFIAAATLIFSWRCPSIIREYGSFEEFERLSGKSEILIKDAVIKYAREARSDEVISQFAARFCNRGGVRLAGFIDLPLPPERFPDMFVMARDLSDKSQWGWRLACTVLYAIGFSLLLVVFAQTVWYVVQFTAGV